MPSYKDEKRNTWYCQFYYKDWTNTKRQKRKRGFARKKDADAWEKNFLDELEKSSDIPFPALVENYLADLSTRLKPTTMETKENIITTKVLPFFKNYKTNEITSLIVRKWQNELIKYRNDKGEPYAETYLRTIHNQLSAILNYAVNYYNLDKNPCRQAGAIGKSKASAMKIWTLDEYEEFISYENKPASKLAFDILYWSGCREGELLALTKNNFIVNGDEYKLDISGNYQVVKGKEYILSPKHESYRCISIPKFLYDEMMEYTNSLYDYRPDDRIFYFTKSHVNTEMAAVCKASGITKIRPHDLRHSHASLLIEMGFNILIISQRLGHENVQTTWETYAHLYPDKEKLLATQLDVVKIQGLSQNISAEQQLLSLLEQFQKSLPMLPAKVDIDNEEIICWNPEIKQKTIVTRDEFEEFAEVSTDIEGAMAVAEIFKAGFMEICGLVYCLSSRGLPARYL